jgi:phenylalanyl-tRNA synthetase beta chain
LPADIVEEIVRIDGLDNIEIPTTITISPSTNQHILKENLKEKIANYLTGQGFSEIFTNSITNGKYYDEEILSGTVKMLNSLSADLDVMRPSMLETGLECIAYNNNRRIHNLQLFEFGKTYHTSNIGEYKEEEHLTLYITGNNHEDVWNEKKKTYDFFRAKGIVNAVFALCGVPEIKFVKQEKDLCVNIVANKKTIALCAQVSSEKLQAFDIKQPVFFIDIKFEALLNLVAEKKIIYSEVPKFPAVQRDLALIVNKTITYEAIESTIQKTKLSKLQSVRLFDIFESDKLGADKKSMAINFTFMDEDKTLTDKEVDAMMNKLIEQFEKEAGAEIRK